MSADNPIDHRQLLEQLKDAAGSLQVAVIIDADGAGRMAWWARRRRKARPQEKGSYQLLPAWRSGARVMVQVRDELPADEQCRVLIHELSHALLHGNPLAGCTPTRIRELEAASCEMEVVSRLGLDTTDTVDYLNHWSDGGEHQLSRERRDHVARVANRLHLAIESAGKTLERA